MSEQQKICYEISKLLWSVMAVDAQKIIYRAAIYPHFCRIHAHWIDHQGCYKTLYEGTKRPIIMKVEERVRELLQKLQYIQRFEEHIWTQCVVSIDKDSHLHIEYANIPEKDHWPCLFLRGISDLSEVEAVQQLHIPKEIWKDCVHHRQQMYDDLAQYQFKSLS